MMDQKLKDVLAISHGYTQKMGEIHSRDKWIGRMFWNSATILETGHCPACKLLQIDGDQAIMETAPDGPKVIWPLNTLVYGKARNEAEGFVMYMPHLSVEDRINLMVDPNGHGYGFLIGEDSL